jgi:general secretion pathway protein G
MKAERHSLTVSHGFVEGGFTLLEIMLVVVIIGMLVGIAAVKIGGQSEKARFVATMRQIDAYKTAIGIYELENGFYPSTEQGLQALITQPTSQPVPLNWKGPYLDPPVVKPDPWGHDYVYKYPGTHNTTGYDLYSLGKMGVEGDPGNIGNWQ